MVDVWDLAVISLAGSELLFSSLASERGLIQLRISVHVGDGTILAEVVDSVTSGPPPHPHPNAAWAAGLTVFANKAALRLSASLKHTSKHERLRG